jgi:hypothetical protein
MWKDEIKRKLIIQNDPIKKIKIKRMRIKFEKNKMMDNFGFKC